MVVCLSDALLVGASLQSATAVVITDKVSTGLQVGRNGKIIVRVDSFQVLCFYACQTSSEEKITDELEQFITDF